jgi:hypothetical protein
MDQIQQADRMGTSSDFLYVVRVHSHLTNVETQNLFHAREIGLREGELGKFPMP